MINIIRFFLRRKKPNTNRIINFRTSKNLNSINNTINKDGKSLSKEIDVLSKNSAFVNKKIIIGGEEEDIPKESDFFLGHILGSGAHSIVYATTYKKKRYVCKKMKISNKDRALREILILKKLKDNKFFPNYKFHIETKYNLMIFTEYNEAIDVFEFINRLIEKGELTEDIIKDVFLKMTKAIKEFHNKGFNHLDVKMENFIILNNKTLDIKLIDFEMSYEYSKNLKYIKRTIGTSGYSPLESYKHLYNYQTDIWSLGICLWILLTNGMPFYHKNLIVNDTIDIQFMLLPTPDEIKHIDSEALKLVKSILTTDIKKRIELDDIIANKWLNEITYEVK